MLLDLEDIDAPLRGVRRWLDTEVLGSVQFNCTIQC